MDSQENTAPEAHEPVTESHDPPVPEAYSAFMRTGWGERVLDLPAHPITTWAEARRRRLVEEFPHERLVVPAGGFKVRANDTDFRFRAETAHTYLCGNETSDAVLVVEGGESVLYARPRSSRETDEFFRDRQYGELWAGRRPSLKEISDSLGIETRHLDELESRLGGSAKTRVLGGVDHRIDALVDGDSGRDSDFARVLSELRLVKDEWELAELQSACDITTLGFEDSVREWDRVLGARRALAGGHLLPSGPHDGQRHRLRLDRGWRPARDDAALDRQLRSHHARRARAAWTWAPRRPRSTPPT